MKKSSTVWVVAGLMILVGCVSAERQAEYAAWQDSEDGVRTVQLPEFESKYRQGWRERAAEKKKARIAREEAERVRRAKEIAERERLAKERAEAERVRLAKEAAERAEAERLRLRTALCEQIYNKDLKKIRECYSEGKPYINPFHNDGKYWGGRDDYNKDWLSKWASPRLNISEADALAGQALLSEFGTKYLPNAYANYEKKRDALIELQQVFNEEFAQPWTIKTTSPKWSSFNKVLEKFAKARTEYFVCHDELCYYWHLYCFGVYKAEDFVKIDAKPLSVRLRQAKFNPELYAFDKINPLEEKIATFAVKYAPDSNAVYTKMIRELNQLNALLKEVLVERIKMDCVRGSAVLDAAVEKRNLIVGQMNTLAKSIETWYYDHRIMDKTSEDVAKCDFEAAKNLKPFIASLESYIKEDTTGVTIIKASEMIAISDRNYKIQRTEVTQKQWVEVMGNNPSRIKGPNRPVVNVSWNDCQEFIKRLNEIEGKNYRLPTEEEWEYACRAGSTGDWGKRSNGQEGPLDVMGWYNENSGRRSHNVAQKEPNAWGIYDMHGNVWEWCHINASFRVCRGGSWDRSAGRCIVSNRNCYNSDYCCDNLGFRLALSQE